MNWVQNRADGDAMRMSDASANAKPPAIGRAVDGGDDGLPHPRDQALVRSAIVPASACSTGGIMQPGGRLLTETGP